MYMRQEIRDKFMFVLHSSKTHGKWTNSQKIEISDGSVDATGVFPPVTEIRRLSQTEKEEKE